MDAYRQGLWMLPTFTVQTTLSLVLSQALAAPRFFRKTLAALARVPKTEKQVVVLAFLSAGVTSYLYWGLGHALGPVIAIYFADDASELLPYHTAPPT